MAGKKEYHFNGRGQINISNDSSTIHAKYTENNGEKAEEKLRKELLNLIQEVHKESNLNQVQKVQLINKAETIIEDIDEESISRKRLKNFREIIKDYVPEMQLTATFCAAISAVKDATDLFA